MASRLVVLPSAISFGALLSFGLSILSTKCQAETKTPEKIPRVAIIGAGIGGSSTAYFLREILGYEAHIQVFERAAKVGGRLSTVEVAGNTYESGGSIIHPANLYMKTFVEALGLGTLKASVGTFAIYNGEDIVFETSSWSWVSSLKLLWRYGISLFKVKSITDKMLEQFSNIYKVQGENKVFSSVPEMLHAMGGEEFYKMTQVSIEKFLQEKGVSQLLIDELVMAVMKNNYNQDTQVNAFTGCVSLAGAQPGLWAVKGGNWNVCKGLLAKSKVIINKDTHIIEIIKKNLPDQPKPVYFLRSDKTLISTPFDVVILAMPLAVHDNFIGCDGCQKWPSQSQLGKFQQTVATFVQGNVNGTTFSSSKASTIFTMEKTEILFSSVGKETTVLGKEPEKNDTAVWKVFSRQPLTKELKEKLFSESENTKEVYWQAYPHYTPPEKFQPFVLDEGVFYVNAIEWAASAMEMSALSGRNAALLTGQYFGKEKFVQTQDGNKHSEL